MKHAKQLLVAGVVTASVIGGGAYALTASAQSPDSSGGLASRIAQKFNLNQDEVQGVITDYHKEHRQERLNDQLSQAVEDGKITEDQKSQILTYLSENQPALDDGEDQSRETRRDAMKSFREEFKQWATDNGIDPNVLRPEAHEHKDRHDFGGKGMMHSEDNN